MIPPNMTVGHTTQGDRLILVNVPHARLTPQEARKLAEELLLRADFHENVGDVCIVDGYRLERRKSG